MLITDLEKLEGVRSGELDITKEKIEKILATSVNVVLCNGGIDYLSLKFFVESSAMVVRCVNKSDLKRIANVTGAAFLTPLANMKGEKTFKAFYVGKVAEIVQEFICDDELILIDDPKAT